MNQKILPCTRLTLIRRTQKLFAVTLLTAFSSQTYAQAGDGIAGLTQANKLVSSYFDYGVTLLYAIGAVVGLVGAIKVYNAWSHGDQQTNKLAASWFGACIFLVVVAAVLKSFFGVS